MAGGSEFRRSLAWSVAAVGAIGVIVILIITILPRSSEPEQVSVGAPVPDIPDTTHRDPVGSGRPPASAGRAAIEKADPDSGVGDDHGETPATREAGMGTVVQTSEDEHGLQATDAGENATPSATAEPEKRMESARPTESWIAHEVSSRAGPFLLGERGGVWFRPAPPDQQFVVVRASISWDGGNGHHLALRASDVGYPRLWLRVDQRRVYSVGRLPAGGQPLLPLSPELIPFKPQERIDAAFAFLVPNDVRKASLEVERQVLASLVFEAPATAEVGQLVGSWRRVPSHRRPLRFADPLADSIAAADCQSLRVAKDRGGSIRLLIPCAQTESDPLSAIGAAEGFNIVLHMGSETHEAYLRVVARDPAMLLLCVGDSEEGGKFLYERYGD